MVSSLSVARLNADLSAHADVPTAARAVLQSNVGVCWQGFKLGGSGFICDADEAARLFRADDRNRAVLRPFRNGRDIGARSRGTYVIDFGLSSELEAKEYPLLFDRVRDQVMPVRAANARESYARLWWRFVEPRRELRAAVAGVSRFIVTIETSKFVSLHFWSLRSRRMEHSS
jgi:hypothetical protein